jgi:hypothetical protein
VIERDPGTNNNGDATPSASSYTYISTDTYNRLLAGINHFESRNPSWGLNFNCTDFAAMVAAWAHIDVGDISTMGWSDPDKLAAWIERQNQNNENGNCK